MAPLSRMRVRTRLDRRAGELDARAAALDARAEQLAAAERRLQLTQPFNPAVHDIPGYPRELGPAARALLDRLDASDVEEVERRVEGDLAEAWRHADDVARGYLTLQLGVHYQVPSVLEKTGLTTAVPPEHVHAMARGPLAAGGDPGLADLIMGAIEYAGRGLPREGAALDFGCSSGRALRVLAAVRPDVRWQGCDPNAAAVAWARDALAPVTFFQSSQRPPLDLGTETLDFVYAISVWSHFDGEPALAWLREMFRVLRPGGLLLTTTHGLASVARQLRTGAMVPVDGVRCTEALQREGFWFSPVFGEEGDFGVRDPGWGMAYMTPEWLVTRMLPTWSLLLYEPGRLDANQDVYLFERRTVANHG
ncbi:MAG: class I SAM-dependent methyltransferase [Solirubrobacteraceae bacterium]